MVNADLERLLKNPLVTGAEGYIGSQLVNYLDNLDFVEKITAIDFKERATSQSNLDTMKVEYHKLDLASCGAITQLGAFEPSCVFALAAINGTSRFYSQPWTVYINSLASTLNTLKAFGGIAPIVYSSSSEVYASSVELGIATVPTDENVPLAVSDPHNSRWSYATAKLSGEIALISYAKELDLKGAIVRYHNVYGPRMSLDHFVPDFINRAKSGDFRIYGGSNTRSFLYIQDAIEGTLLALTKASSNVPIYHLGTSEELPIIDAARIILNSMRLNEEITVLPAPEGSVSRRAPDSKKAEIELGWKAKVSFSEGVKRIFET